MNVGRTPLGVFPSAVQKLTLPDGRALIVKRDDLAGFGVAGNKTRALECLMYQAVNDDCSIVVSGGTPKSNFVAAVALAARVAQRECHLLIADVGQTDSPTVALARAWGAHIIPTEYPRELLDEAIEAYAQRSTESGYRAFPIPRGGATPTGAAGFALAVQEVRDQVGVDALSIVIPVGSGGSIAGLAAGIAALALPWTLVGVSVSRPSDDIAHTIEHLSSRTADLIGGPPPLRPVLVDARDATREADDEAARTLRDAAGILLDPIYGMRAASVALERAHTEQVLLWITGGLTGALDHAVRTPAGEVVT